MNPNDEWNQELDDLDAREERLSAWEIDFVESIRELLQCGCSLSPGQEETLKRIHKEHTR